MVRLVLKFGGTSVADPERIQNVARHVRREVMAGHQVAVVLSAMAGQTNHLISLCRKVARIPDAREYDAVVASGEQVTCGLLALALQETGIVARSWQGWQVPILTDSAHGVARILHIDPTHLEEDFNRGCVPILTGFQGVTSEGRIATLGRGGSDTSAVALAAALRADRCDIYTDVDGVYTTDPRIVPKARRLTSITFEEMLEMASLGAKVLQVRSVELAMAKNVPILVRSSFEDPDSPESRFECARGTLICHEESFMEEELVTGIAFSKDEAQISLRNVSDKPGVAARVFGALAQANLNVDMIVQNISADGSTTDITFTVAEADLETALAVLENTKDIIGLGALQGRRDVAKVSVIGVGMRSHAGIAAQCFKALAEKGINILAISTSEIKISVLIDSAYCELAVRTLHQLYALEKETPSSQVLSP